MSGVVSVGDGRVEPALAARGSGRLRRGQAAGRRAQRDGPAPQDRPLRARRPTGPTFIYSAPVRLQLNINTTCTGTASLSSKQSSGLTR